MNGKAVHGVRDVFDAIGLEVGKSIEFRISRKGSGDINISLITAPEN